MAACWYYKYHCIRPCALGFPPYPSIHRADKLSASNSTSVTGISVFDIDKYLGEQTSFNSWAWVSEPRKKVYGWDERLEGMVRHPYIDKPWGPSVSIWYFYWTHLFYFMTGKKSRNDTMDVMDVAGFDWLCVRVEANRAKNPRSKGCLK